MNRGTGSKWKRLERRDSIDEVKPKVTGLLERNIMRKVTVEKKFITVLIVYILQKDIVNQNKYIMKIIKE